MSQPDLPEGNDPVLDDETLDAMQGAAATEAVSKDQLIKLLAEDAPE